MPPRGGQGYDFSPIVSHYVFLVTFILAFAGWFAAFIGQAAATAKFGHNVVGVGWFAIFLQLFVILGVLHTLASDAIAMHRFQIAVFTAVALVFAVIGTNNGIYADVASLQAMGAGYLLLAVVDIIWALYFTSEEDSLQLHVFNSMGTGGLTPPGRHRRRTTIPGGRSSIAPGMQNQSTSYGGYNGAGSAAPMGNGNGNGMSKRDDVSQVGVRGGGGGVGGIGSLSGGPTHEMTANSNNGGALHTAMGNQGPHTPLMAAGGMGDTSTGSANAASDTDGEGYAYRAKALYAYTASADDPNEISFTKGEILEIVDNAGKWWQAKKSDGQRGIAPSNYLQII